MPTINDLGKVLEEVHLSGTIDECVVVVADGVATVLAMDMTSSLFIQSSCPSPIAGDHRLGIGNLALFCRYLNMCKDYEVALTLVDNKLSIKKEKGTVVRYLLSDADLVPTYDSAWEDAGNAVEDELSAFDPSNRLELTDEAVSEFLSVMKLFTPNSVLISVGKRGLVSLHGGRETEHEFDCALGSIKAFKGEPFVVRILGSHLTAVFSRLDHTQEPTIWLQAEQSAIVQATRSTWILQPIKDEVQHGS